MGGRRAYRIEEAPPPPTAESPTRHSSAEDGADVPEVKEIRRRLLR